jgi:hypothetical protein
VLIRAAQPEAALAQYDTMIAWHPTAALLLERAHFNARR